VKFYYKTLSKAIIAPFRVVFSSLVYSSFLFMVWLRKELSLLTDLFTVFSSGCRKNDWLLLFAESIELFDFRCARYLKLF